MQTMQFMRNDINSEMNIGLFLLMAKSIFNIKIIKTILKWCAFFTQYTQTLNNHQNNLIRFHMRICWMN